VIDSIAKQPTDRNDRPKGEVRMEIEMADWGWLRQKIIDKRQKINCAL
jgi:hypothetical protein